MDELIEILMNTREFCGNETEALSEWESENGELSDHQKRNVLSDFEKEWSILQFQAGVLTPLSDEDRKRAFSEIESGA